MFCGALGYTSPTALTLPFMAAAGIDGLPRSLGRTLLPDFSIPPRLAWGILAGILLFWALRNIPLYPLLILAP